VTAAKTTLALGAGAVALIGAAAPGAVGPPAQRHAPAARTVTVNLGEYFFRPHRVTVKAGTPVRFVNVGRIEHTVADSTKGGMIRSRLIHPRPLRHGQTQAVTLRKPGTVYYLCTFHPQLMRGVITVVR
jgi:plastocyanin